MSCHRNADLGLYSCELVQVRRDGSYATVKTNGTTVKMEPFAPCFITEPPEKICAEFGSVVHLECHAEGYPTPDIQWYKNNELLPGKHSSVLKAEYSFIIQFVNILRCISDLLDVFVFSV